jgi:hypothetical protein
LQIELAKYVAGVWRVVSLPTFQPNQELFMKPFLLLFLFTTLLPAFGTPPENDRTQFIDFFRREVLPKRLLTEVKGKTEDAQYYVNFRRVIAFGNFRTTKNGIIFDFRSMIKQTNTKLDAQGKPTGEIINRDRTVIRRVELALRQSTGKLVGFARTLSDSAEDPTGDATAVSIEMAADGRSMEIHHSTVLYDDGTLDEKTFVPVAIAEVSTLSLESGRLKMDQKYMGFRVDPATNEKTMVDQFEVESHELN